MQKRRLSAISWRIAVMCALASVAAAANEPKPTAENTITVQLAEAVKPQAFSRPLKFFVLDMIDRSGNAQPMLVFKPRGGIFLDRTPTEITRAGLEDCLRSANMLATDRQSADFLLTVYLFNFGLSESSGMDFFGKVEFAVILKNPQSGRSQQITASGTSIAGGAARKKNLQKNVQEDIDHALEDALRNLLRGVKLRDAVNSMDTTAQPSASPPPPAAPAAASVAAKPGKQN
jgi:hypothetical protein